MIVKFRGIFDTSLGGFPCIRGFARLADLARISKPNKDYQRDLIKSHKAEIRDFLEDKEYLFFPEVVLFCSLKYDFTKKNAISGLNPMKQILKRGNFRSNVDGLSISFFNRYSTAQISLNDEKTHLTRVDGNHRLSAGRIKAFLWGIHNPFLHFDI